MNDENRNEGERLIINIDMNACCKGVVVMP